MWTQTFLLALAQLACYMASSWCPLYPWPISARARGREREGKAISWCPFPHCVHCAFVQADCIAISHAIAPFARSRIAHSDKLYWTAHFNKYYYHIEYCYYCDYCYNYHIVTPLPLSCGWPAGHVGGIGCSLGFRIVLQTWKVMYYWLGARVCSISLQISCVGLHNRTKCLWQ